MSRILSVGLTALSLLASAPAFAAHNCSCDKQCTANCAKGTKESHCNCKDKDCGCAKGTGCKHGKCHAKEHHSE